VTSADLVDVAAMLALHARDSVGPAENGQPRPVLMTLKAVDRLNIEWHRIFSSDSAGSASLDAAAIEEMLEAELLLRVWTAHLTHTRTAANLSENCSRSLSLLRTAILEQRRRVLLAILNDDRLKTSQRSLDRSRRVMERWTDMLLAAFRGLPAASSLQFDSDRRTDFAELWQSHRWLSGAPQEPLMIASMREAIPDHPIQSPEREAAYRELVGTILQCVGGDAFTRAGRWRTWKTRQLDTAIANTVPDEKFRRVCRPRSFEI
jgi:hypothetical protein